MKNIHIILLAVVVLLVSIAAWSIRSRIGGEDTSSAPLSPPATTTKQGDVVTDSPGIQYGYVTATSTVPTSIPKGFSVPDINRPIIIPPRFAPDVAPSATADIQRIIISLKENPTNAALWGTLGLKRHGIEDYEGARQAYEYSLALAPNNGVTAENLGVLYGYYLHEPIKAEKYFLEALDIEPLDYRYMRLYELYKDIMRNTAKARAILERGLKEYPGNASFKTLLESL